MNGLPPHIAQIIAGHRDINVTLGYKAIYPEEAIQAHLAFLARRRALRPSEEYRDTHRRPNGKSSSATSNAARSPLGTCGRAYATPASTNTHASAARMLWPDPAQRPRLAEIRDNLIARIAEAEHKAGSAKSKDSPSASPAPTTNSPRSTAPPNSTRSCSACPHRRCRRTRRRTGPQRPPG